MSIDKGVNLPEYLQEKITSIRAKSIDIDNIYANIIQDTDFDIFSEECYTNIEKNTNFRTLVKLYVYSGNFDNEYPFHKTEKLRAI